MVIEESYDQSEQRNRTLMKNKAKLQRQILEAEKRKIEKEIELLRAKLALKNIELAQEQSSNYATK